MTITTSEDVRGDEQTAGPSDAELLARVRDGDRDAYGELYGRHEPAAASLARYLTRSDHEADDVVADAFARVLRAIDNGAGPTEAFRPYLLTAVRRTVWRRSERAEANGRLAASEDEAELLDLRLAVEPEDRSDEAIVLQAFKELPERWQLVLWHTEIEGQPPAEVAPLLGLSANATAALAVRAREGLRQAYLQAHLQARPADHCRFSVEHLGSFVRDGLGKRDTAKVEAHLEDCGDCRELKADLGSLNKALRSVVGPAVLGAGAARYLQDAGAASGPGPGGAVEQAHAVAHRLRFPQAVGLAGAAAALLVTLGVRSDLAEPPSPVVAEAAPAAAVTPTGELVRSTLVGSPDTRTPGAATAPCAGVGQPLSLPRGSTVTGASLVEAPEGGDAPRTVPAAEAGALAPVPSGDTTLVGDGAACITELIAPLDGAPRDTALAVTFLDRLGNLQILLVPDVVSVVQQAVRDVAVLAESLDARLQQWLTAVQEAADQLAAGGGGAAGGTGDTGGGAGSIPGVPDVDVPAPPSLPPVVDGVGGVVDDTVGGVGGIVDGVVGGVGDGLGGLLD